MVSNKQLNFIYDLTQIQNINEQQNQQSTGNSCFSFAFKNQSCYPNLISYSLQKNDDCEKFFGTQVQTQPTTTQQKDKFSTDWTTYSNFEIKKKTDNKLNQWNNPKNINKYFIQKLSSNNLIRGTSMPQIFQQKYRQKKSRLSKYKPQNNQNSSYFIHQKQYNNNIYQYQHQIKKLQNNINILKQQQLSTDLKIQQYDYQINLLKSNLSHLHQNNINHQDNSLQIQLQSIHEQLQQQKQINQDLIKQNQQLMIQLKQVLYQDTQQITNLSQQLSKIKQQNTKLKQQTQQQKSTINIVNNSINLKNQQITKLQHTQKILKQQLLINHQQKKQKQRLQKQCQTLNNQIQSLQNTITTLTQQLQKQKTTITTYEQLLQQKQQQYQKLTQNIQKQQNKLQQITQQNQTLKNISSSNLDQYQNQLSNNYALIKNLENKVAALEKQCEDLENNNKYDYSSKLAKCNTLLQFHDKVCQLMNLPHTSKTSKIINQIQNLKQMSIKNNAALSNYFTIFPLFGIQQIDQSCHQKFVNEIYQLLNQIITFQKQTKYLTSQNIKLFTKIKMITQPNLSIIKYDTNDTNQSSKSRKCFTHSTI